MSDRGQKLHGNERASSGDLLPNLRIHLLLTAKITRAEGERSMAAGSSARARKGGS